LYVDVTNGAGTSRNDLVIGMKPLHEEQAANGEQFASSPFFSEPLNSMAACSSPQLSHKQHGITEPTATSKLNINAISGFMLQS
jgi:hypothetical protein